MVPFSSDQFFEVFTVYNRAVWPAQWILLALAAAAPALTLQRRPANGAVITILALLWLWMGVVYHVMSFRAINPVAPAFGAAFVVQAAAFVWAGARGRLVFRPRLDAAGLAGAALITYALLIYPLLGYGLGHRYPASPTFGTPCPTTIFTFGLLLWTDLRVPLRLLVIPGLWAVIGLSAALSLGVPQDLGLFLAGAVAVTLVIRRRLLRRAQAW